MLIAARERMSNNFDITEKWWNSRHLISVLIIYYSSKKSKQSVFFNLLLHLVFVNYFLEIPQSLCSVIVYILLLDTLADYLVKDDLETHWNATSLKIIIVVLSYLFDFGVFLLWSFLNTWFLHHLWLKLLWSNKKDYDDRDSLISFYWFLWSVEALIFYLGQSFYVVHHFFVPESFLHFVTKFVEISLGLWVKELEG